jgi:2-polyprenyl-3-methyl-5-hydroxy-6-metoxy-1,4-benzoquinol methylase
MGLNCRYCGSKNLSVETHIDGYDINKCNNCLLLQTKVDNTRIKKINNDKYNEVYIESYLKIRKPQLMEDFKKSIKEIEGIKLGGNILDVGCGTGIFLETLNNFSKYTWNLVGIDINTNSISKTPLCIRKCIVKKSINNNRFQSNYFDVITCFDMLEHSSDIRKSLIEIRRILKDDGLLLIQVPNNNSFMKFFTKNDWDWWCVPDHIFHFTKNTISNILIDNGYKIIKIRTWENSDIFIKNIQGHLKKLFPKMFNLNKIIAKLIYVPLYLLWYISNKVIWNYEYGGLIYLLAIKQ